MNGLSTNEEHLKLVAIMFQNIFPPITVNTVESPVASIHADHEFSMI